MDGGGGGGRARDNKRVRFSYEEPDPDDDEQENRPRKLRFPKGRKDAGDVGPVSRDSSKTAATDARIAATERAVRRNAMDEQLRRAEDASNINDVAQAEEDFQNDDDESVKMEPFNLNAERKDGFFDDDGHYVEYETKFEARDAWLDSVEVDTRFANQLAQSRQEEAEPELSARDLGRMKKRIADVLLPGETVLEALRRLRGSTKNGKREKLTGPAKITFDQLTEDAMKVMDSGEIDVYEKPQEKFRREADAVLKEEERFVDIFADEPATATQVTEEASSDADGNAGSFDAGNGYVFDGSSGYYYNAAIGYFYDPNSGLYGSEASGKWFKFDESSNAYVEAV